VAILRGKNIRDLPAAISIVNQRVGGSTSQVTAELNKPVNTVSIITFKIPGVPRFFSPHASLLLPDQFPVFNVQSTDEDRDD